MATTPQLLAATNSLEALDEVRAGNLGDEGWWRRFALAAEGLAGAATTANETQEGWMLRAALALEAITGTSGAEENAGEEGLLKRIVDALEDGEAGSGSLSNRLVTAAIVFSGGDPAPDVTAPTITSANPSGSFVEGEAVGGTLTANEAVTWAVTGADAADVTLDADTGVWTLEETVFATKASYAFSFVATDLAANASAPQVVAITITEYVVPTINAPILSLTSNTTYPPPLEVDFDETVVENDVLRVQSSATLDFATPIINDTSTLDAAAITAGEVSVTGLSSIEDPDETYFRARIERGGDVSAWSAIVKHGDVTAPTITSANTFSTAENSSYDHALTANEEIVLWAVTGGTLAGSASIVSGSTLRLAAQDYETTPSGTIVVTATDYSGNTTDQTITATITDVDDTAPTITSVSTINNVEAEVLAHSLTANETVTWSIVGGADAADFELSGSTLRYASNGTKAYTGSDDSYSVAVRATDTVGNWSEQTITVTVIEAEAIPSDYIVKLEADDLSSMFQTITGTTPVAADNDVVGTWQNKAANARHLTAPANDSTRPTYNTDGTLHWVESDGTNDILQWAGDMGMYNGGACSVFVATRANPGAASRVLIGEGGLTQAIYTGLFSSNVSPFANAAAFIRYDGSFDIPVTSPLVANAFDNTDNVVGVTDNGSQMIGYLDGVAGTTRNYTRAGTSTFNRFTLFGSRRAGGWELFFNARIYAVLIYPRVVNSTERAQIVTWLGAKMGRTL